MAGKFELKVLSPSRQLASQTVTSVTLPGTAGYMTILPDHAAMIAELEIGEVTVLVAGSAAAETYFISGGYVEVDHNKVVIMADVIERAQEIDVKRAQDARKRAAERLAALKADVDIERANRSLRRADLRLLIAEAMAKLARNF
jgi:F-type H+-transporting ATPase subunit epsilon